MRHEGEREVRDEKEEMERMGWCREKEKEEGVKKDREPGGQEK
jgi:hypothetical protein